jgi:hypothetical protein
LGIGHGTNIRGHVRSQQELLEASGYAARPKDFAELIRILDAGLRLITPADDAGADSSPHQVPASSGWREENHPDRSPHAPREGNHHAERDAYCTAAEPAPRFYQLTHDYLVPSLRDWLTRKQRETRRGRAELRLAERAAAYNAKRDPRNLPGWWEWPNILLCTRRRNWNSAERRVMRAATRRRGLQAVLVAMVSLAALLAGHEARRRVEEDRDRLQAAAIVQRLLEAPLAAVPADRSRRASSTLRRRPAPSWPARSPPIKSSNRTSPPSAGSG